MNQIAQKAVIGWVSDPAHGWLKVSLAEDGGFPEAKEFASQWSFFDYGQKDFGGVVYLEEDEDAPAFIKQYGLDDKAWSESYLSENNQIRDLPRGKGMDKATADFFQAVVNN